MKNWLDKWCQRLSAISERLAICLLFFFIAGCPRPQRFEMMYDHERVARLERSDLFYHDHAKPKKGKRYDRAFENYKGYIGHNIPSRLELRKRYIIKAGVIRSRLMKELLAAKIGTSEDKIIELISAARMVIKLKSEPSAGIGIELLSEGEKPQPLLDNRPTIWAWAVTPNRLGQHRLLLEIIDAADVDKREERLTSAVLDFAIDVDSVGIVSDENHVASHGPTVERGNLSVSIDSLTQLALDKNPYRASTKKLTRTTKPDNDLQFLLRVKGPLAPTPKEKKIYHEYSDPNHARVYWRDSIEYRIWAAALIIVLLTIGYVKFTAKTSPGAIICKKSSDNVMARELINDLLVCDSDLDGFCLDYYAQIQSRFSNGMDRIAKVNIILKLEQDKKRLIDNLQTWHERASRLPKA